MSGPSGNWLGSRPGTDRPDRQDARLELGGEALRAIGIDLDQVKGTVTANFGPDAWARPADLRTAARTSLDDVA